MTSAKDTRSEKLKALITQRLEVEAGDANSVRSLALVAANTDAGASSTGEPGDATNTRVSVTLTSTVMFTRSDWLALGASAGNAKVEEVVDGLWSRRFDLLVDTIRARVLHDLEATAKGYGKAVGAAQCAEKVDAAFEDLASARSRALAMDGLLQEGVAGPRPTVEGLEGWMQAPVLVSCADPVGVTALLADQPNAIRRASTPDTAPAASPLARSAAVIGSKSQAHAAIWQVNRAAAVAVVETNGTLVATVTEKVSAQAESEACLVWLPFTS